MKTITDSKNILLKRREVKIIVKSEGNPGFEKSSKLIAEQFKSKEEFVSVRNVKGKFGRDTFLIDAMIYNSKEDKDRIEPRAKVKAEGTAQAPAAGAK